MSIEATAVSPRLRQRAAVSVALIWVVLAAVIEFGLGYYLSGAGQSKAGPPVWVGLSILVLGIATYLVARIVTPRLTSWGSRSAAVLIVGSILTGLAALLWTYAGALPMSVILNGSQLSGDLHQAQSSSLDSSGCVQSPHSFPAVPALGQPDSVCISNGVFAFLRGTPGHTYGLVWVPQSVAAATAIMPLNVSLEGSYGCVDALADGWWEVAYGGWSDAGVKGNGSCPFGVGNNSL